MSQSARTIRFRAVDIALPEGMREELAQEIAARMDAHLREIESTANRLDDRAFALQLAFDYAVRLHQLGQERATETAALTKAVAELNEEIEAAIAKGGGVGGGPSPEGTTPFGGRRG